MVKEPTDIERERRALDVFGEVLEAAPAEREAVLVAACGGEPQLEREVRRLCERLEDERQAPRELEASLPGPVGLDGPELASGSRIGRYELVRSIGRGGMGRVYEAIQDSPRRRVALKMLRRGLASSEARKRFLWESEILASLRHPGIAQIYTADVHREESALGPCEIPFFALEYVEGARTIERYVLEEGLERSEIVELFAEVCEAVHHGHQKGVIHRDLKPGNVLVDSAGHAKVIDFGIARVMDPDPETTSVETQAGQLMGTVPYMSPEQLGDDPADIDTRSDVYALGVVLYELVCGRLPIDVDGLAIAAAILKVRDEEPMRPRRVAPALPADLELIVLRALSKDRDRRYPSAIALADDLRRFIAREPIEARPPTAAYRLRLFARRNPALIGALVAIGLTLVVATVVSVRFGMDARDALDVKDQQIEVANEARTAERDARTEADRMKNQVLAFNQAVVTDLVQNLARQGMTTREFRDVRLVTVDRLEALRQAAGTDIDVLTSLANSYLSLGNVLGNPTQTNLGEPEEAREAYAKAFELGVSLAQLAPRSPTGRRIQAVTQRRTADLDRLTPPVLKEYERVLGELRELREDFPEDDETLNEIVYLLSRLGTGYGGVRRDHELALRTFSEALELMDSYDTEPDSMLRRRNLNSLRGKKGVALVRLERFDEARGVLVSALEEHEELSRSYPEEATRRSDVAESLIQLTDCESRAGAHAAADEYCGRSMEILEELLAQDPSNARVASSRVLATFTLARCHHRWAEDERASGKDAGEHYDLARSNYELAREYIDEIRRSGQPLNHLAPMTADIAGRLADIERAGGADSGSSRK